jgi:hypothetical protein
LWKGRRTVSIPFIEYAKLCEMEPEKQRIVIDNYIELVTKREQHAAKVGRLVLGSIVGVAIAFGCVYGAFWLAGVV